MSHMRPDFNDRPDPDMEPLRFLRWVLRDRDDHPGSVFLSAVDGLHRTGKSTGRWSGGPVGELLEAEVKQFDARRRLINVAVVTAAVLVGWLIWRVGGSR